MRLIRIKAARFIFAQLMKDGKLPPDQVFNEDDVNIFDIKDGERYYSGFTFMSSLAPQYASLGRLSSTSDGSHCEGKGYQSYGTFFDVSNYDQNKNLCSLVCGHSIGNEGGHFWKKIFTAAKSIPGYDVPKRVCLVDMEKSIGTSFEAVMEHATPFYDERHVLKNMLPVIGAEKASTAVLYPRALRAPSTQEVDAIVAQYGPKTKAYLARFRNNRLYRAYCDGLGDLVITSQGAESQMNAALRNKIRCVEPQAMLENIVSSQRAKFYRLKAIAESCDAPVPPRIEEALAVVLEKSKAYPHVEPVPGSNMMEFDVRGIRDPLSVKRVVLSLLPQTPPSCCAYSQTSDEIPCYHGTAALTYKHGACNLHKFISNRHLTSTWKQLYHEQHFNVPLQHDVDAVVLAAKMHVASGDYLQSPKALPPPRGRPVKNAGVRRRSWLENGASKTKKRAYTCALCHLTGHTRKKCDLRQIFENVNENFDADSDENDDRDSESDI